MGTTKVFTATDIDRAGTLPRIWVNDKAVDLVNRPLWFHLRGLAETATGYGARLRTSHMIRWQGRRKGIVLRRVYCTIWGNAGSCWVVLDGEKVWID
jgi:hypothetical protein